MPKEAIMFALTRRMLLLSLTHTILLTPFVKTEAAQEETKPASSKPLGENSKAPAIVQFTPPQGWVAADSASLPPTVKAMVIGKGKGNFPPSINLGMEPYNGTVKQYLKIIKAINDSQGSQWKDLGTIRTSAGEASLSQVDTQTEWGDVRMMHVIIKKDGNIYILTAAAKKDEFASYYKTFFDSMRSLRFIENPQDSLTDKGQKETLAFKINQIKTAFNQEVSNSKNESNILNNSEIKLTVFKSESFQKKQWQPFVQALNKDYSQMGQEWKTLLLENLQTELLADKKK